MGEHPIEGLMTTAMDSIKDMVDVNTIVGDAVQAPDGTVIIPISRVAFGFAAGGGEYNKSFDEKVEDRDDEDEESGGRKGHSAKYPFAGGSGAGVSINPVAFMVVGNGQMKLMPVNINSSLDRVLDLVPELVNKANETIKKKITVRKELKNGDIKEESEKFVKPEKVEKRYKESDEE